MTPLEDAKAILAAAIRENPQTIADTASVENLADWDSIAHVNVMLALEERAGVPLAPEIVVAIVSVRDIADYLEHLSSQ